MEKKYQIFISSTFTDLKEERLEITKQIIEMGHIPSGMEAFPATSQDQFEYIEQIIDNCDYYILIIGGRYGSLTEEGISYTEREYEYAESQNKKILTFIHGNPGKIPSELVESSPEAKQKLDRFKQKLTDQGRNVKFWKTKEDLKSTVGSSLHHAITSNPSVGWIRGDLKIKDGNSELKEIQSKLWRLQHEKESLEKKLQSAESAILDQFMKKTKPATDQEIKKWVKGAQEKYENINIDHLRNIRYADKDFVLPTLHGANSIAVLVEEGVNIFRGNGIGHSTILYMDGFRKEGVL